MSTVSTPRRGAYGVDTPAQAALMGGLVVVAVVVVVYPVLEALRVVRPGAAWSSWTSSRPPSTAGRWPNPARWRSPIAGPAGGCGGADPGSRPGSSARSVLRDSAAGETPDATGLSIALLTRAVPHVEEC